VKASPLQEIYFQYVHLLAQLEGKVDFPIVDGIERSLLNFIAMHAMQGKQLLVGDVIFLNKSASPATLNRRLSKLAQAGLIRYGSDTDGRKKYLELTPKSQDYFAQLGQCIASASNQT
jgi:DNA-binding HxlR family transcriptional regulator